MFRTSWEMMDESNGKSTFYPGINPIIQKILRTKGITDRDEMEEFLSPKPKKTHDPFTMKNMNEVVNTVIQYIKQQKNIWIYGDYDVDGISSISVLMDFLSNFTNHLNYYIPIREEEGYGLNCDAICEIKDKGADLIITVDCGSTSVNEVQLAKELGMEIIITDHHNLSEEVPNCLILNPKQQGCMYPFKLLCGCGVAFKLVQAISKRLDGSKKHLNDVLDLVALATVADVVPLIDENRTLLKYGLRKLNNVTRPGLKSLIEGVRLAGKEITAGHIGFVLGPHFNASGRIDDARASVELLLTKDHSKIQKLIHHLIACNGERKAIQEKGLEICNKKVEDLHREDLFLVVDSEGIHEGVIGIVAGRIRDLYYRPTLIVTQSSDEHVLKGSGRSIEGIDIYEEMKKCEDLFIGFGGHKNACGFSIEKSKLNLLRERLNKQAQEMMNHSPEVFVKNIKIYAELEPFDMNEKLIEELEKIEPYGMGNEKPQFLLRQIKVNNSPQEVIMGKDGDHLRLKGASSAYKDQTPIQAIGFSMAQRYIHQLGCPETVDMVGCPKINEWNGYKNIQFAITDLKKVESDKSA